MDQSIPPFGDGENVTLTSTEVPQASMLQTSVHGCDAPVADVTRVLRTCAPLHPARARLMAAAIAPWRKSRCRIASGNRIPRGQLAVLHALLHGQEQQKRPAHTLLALDGIGLLPRRSF